MGETILKLLNSPYYPLGLLIIFVLIVIGLIRYFCVSKKELEKVKTDYAIDKAKRDGELSKYPTWDKIERTVDKLEQTIDKLGKDLKELFRAEIKGANK